MISGVTITDNLISLVMSLTPIERLEAARRLDSSMPASTERLFIYLGVIAVGILVIMLLIISFQRRVRERKNTANAFKKHAERRGLSENECRILMRIAKIAGLKRSASIFTMSSAFDRGASAVIEKSFSNHDVEYGQRLRSEIAFLREKLGFQKQQLDTKAWMREPEKLSTRRIPVGKKLYLSKRGNRSEPQVDGAIIKSDDANITVQFDSAVDLKSGDLLCVNYYFGVSAWEFDSSVMSCDGNTLILHHADRVRFINRRRFLRVAVDKTAFVAHYPFDKIFTFRTEINEDENLHSQTERQISNKVWGVPEFVPGMITEIAGPGLRIKTPLELNTGEKVLVIFKLNEIREQDPKSENGQIHTVRVVEGIGKVKHVSTFEDGLQVAVELFGLDDSELNELIRATNSASLNANGNDVSDESSDVPEDVHRAALVSKGD
ncbi:MAG: PilZ domain-containing protein [Planctomycetota bacterium]